MSQLGFCFADIVPSFALAAPGTWDQSGRCATAADHAARLDAAEAALQSIVGPARPLFAQRIAAERDALQEQVARMELAPDEEFTVWGARDSYEDYEVAPFIEHCRAMRGVGFEGIEIEIEFKVREDRAMVVAAMYVAGVGSLVARIWPGLSAGLDYSLERDAFFLASYQDSAPTIVMDCGEPPASMCQRLCESETKIPVAITNEINGRKYVITGASYGGRSEMWTAQAWTVIPATQWDGPTFTYRSMIEEYDAGTMQRGDHRGQLLTVRGELCVLDSFATLTGVYVPRRYDRAASEADEAAPTEDEQTEDFAMDWED